MDSNAVCEITVIDTEKVNKVKQNLPDNNSVLDLSEMFKVLGDSTRLKILLILSLEELCVCDISAILEISVSAISHQLRILRNQKLVKFRKKGKMVFYSLVDNCVENIVREAKRHIEE